MNHSVIELRNVHKSYMMGDYKSEILRGINLKIKHGERIAILGPSGSGKSTILNIMGALDYPTKGEVLMEGKNTRNLTSNQLARLRGKKIGFVFQFYHLIPSMNVLQNVLLPMTFFGKRDEEKAKELLKSVGLENRMHYMPNKLSGGERQRVAIARALINDPEAILADEPTGNLDSKAGHQILDILLKLNKEKNITLVMITHDVSITEHMQRVVYLKDGMIVKEK
jgi:putative ABC transport system ATP-binding protein